MVGSEYKNTQDTLVERIGESEVVYPPVVIAHITREPLDIIKPHLKDKKVVRIHYSSQPNGSPHLGTMTSLGLAFTIGQRVKETLGLETFVTFEGLDNAPCNKKNINGETYYMSLKDHFVEGESIATTNMRYFQELMDYFKMRSGVEYKTEMYSEIQKQPFFRKTLLEILKRESDFAPLLAPLEEHIKLRFPCPTCKYAEKTGKNCKTNVSTEGDLILENECHEHGKYRIMLKEDNQDFIDLNTPCGSVEPKGSHIEKLKNTPI